MKSSKHDGQETLSHRLVVPGDANHYGTLYAGALLRIALEAGYAAAYRAVGSQANLVLRRVLNLECYQPVPVGRVVEIRGRPLLVKRAYMVVGLIGSPLDEHQGNWMDALMAFAQVDENGRVAPFPGELMIDEPRDEVWRALMRRMQTIQRMLRSMDGRE